MTKRPLSPGDYVLATRWSDGDPCDPYIVGFFVSEEDGKFMVKGSGTPLLDGSRFSRCERISKRVGDALVRAFPYIGNRPGKSVWYWRRHIKQLEEFLEKEDRP